MQRPRRHTKKLCRTGPRAIPEHARGKPIELWWQDEARVGQQGSLTYIWAEKGSRPRAPRDQRYGWAYLFGAVCPARGVGAALVLPFVNTEAMNLHLAEISTQVAPGATRSSPSTAPAGISSAASSTARQHQPAAAAALFAGAEPGRKHLAVPTPEPPRKSRLRLAITPSSTPAARPWNALIAVPDTIRSIASRPWAEPVQA